MRLLRTEWHGPAGCGRLHSLRRVSGVGLATQFSQGFTGRAGIGLAAQFSHGQRGGVGSTVLAVSACMHWQHSFRNASGVGLASTVFPGYRRPNRGRVSKSMPNQKKSYVRMFSLIRSCFPSHPVLLTPSPLLSSPLVPPNFYQSWLKTVVITWLIPVIHGTPNLKRKMRKG